MVVDDLDVQGPKFRPYKTDPPLGIDADAVLANALPVKASRRLPGGDFKKSSVAALSSICSFRSATA
jgi:hypothetical protein